MPGFFERKKSFLGRNMNFLRYKSFIIASRLVAISFSVPDINRNHVDFGVWIRYNLACSKYFYPVQIKIKLVLKSYKMRRFSYDVKESE